MYLLRHAWRMVIRDPRRTLASLLGVAIASALVVSVVLFGTASGTTVTRRALATSPVDAQAILPPGVDRTAIIPSLAADPAVVAALPFDLVHFDGVELVKAGAADPDERGCGRWHRSDLQRDDGPVQALLRRHGRRRGDHQS